MIHNRKKTSFNLDENLLDEFKIMSIRQKISQTELLEKYIKLGLEYEKNKKKIKKSVPEFLINNKDTYNPDPEVYISYMGTLETDKNFDPVDEIKKNRAKEWLF